MEVRETKKFSKQIGKAAPELKTKYFTWYKSIEKDGYEKVKRQTSWGDHSLRGQYEGQRAIYLSGKWRAIYEIIEDEIKFIEMQEITPHDYKK